MENIDNRNRLILSTHTHTHTHTENHTQLCSTSFITGIFPLTIIFISGLASRKSKWYIILGKISWGGKKKRGNVEIFFTKMLVAECFEELAYKSNEHMLTFLLHLH